MQFVNEPSYPVRFQNLYFPGYFSIETLPPGTWMILVSTAPLVHLKRYTSQEDDKPDI